MPYFGYALLNPSICVAIKHNSSTSHAIFWQYTFKSFNFFYITVSANSNENTAFGTVGGSEHTIILQRGEWDIN
jgi:hypothetical protein